MSERKTFVTTSRGLRRDLLPMRLFEKAKRFGIWNPSELDFRKDIQDWGSFDETEKDVILRLTAMFQAGEEAVTLDLLPLIQVIAEEGRLEEEMYLTTFLWEEAKHTDFFRRFLDEVAGHTGDLGQYVSDNYASIVYHALPEAMGRLRTDPSPEAQVRASVTYNLIVEGVLAETGYQAYFTALESNDLLPGVRQGVLKLKQDESRHIAYGIYLLSRLVAEDDTLWEVLEETMNTLLPPALAVIGDVFANYDPAPFGLVEEDFIDYALGQYQKRIERLERARTMSLAEITAITNGVIDREDA